MKKLLAMAALMSLGAGFCAQGASVDAIKVSGSDVLGEKISKELATSAGNLGLNLKISMNGSRDGIDLLKKGESDVAIVAIPQGQPMPEGFVLMPYVHQIAAIVVNKVNPLEEISISQLKQIFGSSGEKVDTWEKFGLNTNSALRNIYPLTVPLKENLALELFKNECLNNSNISSNVDIRKSSADVLDIVKTTTNAIGLVGIIPPDDVKVLAVSDNSELASKQAFKPTIDNIQNGDYPINLTFYLMYKRENTKKLRPILQILLSDSIAKVIEDGGLTPSPKNFRKSYSLELDIQK